MLDDNPDMAVILAKVAVSHVYGAMHPAARREPRVVGCKIWIARFRVLAAQAWHARSIIGSTMPADQGTEPRYRRRIGTIPKSGYRFSTRSCPNKSSVVSLPLRAGRAAALLN